MGNLELKTVAVDLKIHYSTNVLFYRGKSSTFDVTKLTTDRAGSPKLAFLGNVLMLSVMVSLPLDTT